MKTYRIIIAAMAAAMALSCQDALQIEPVNKVLEPMTISTDVETRTSLNGTEIHWTSDDVIAVFDNAGAKNEFTITSAKGTSADFTGSVTEGTTQIYAVYPYNLAESVSGSTIKVTIPADQTSKSGSFAEEHNISVAKAPKTPGVPEVSGVSFKNACALLKFTVPAYIADVKQVTLSSNTAMAGEMSIDFSGDVPVCTLAENGSKSISMTGSYEAGSTFWFVLAPVTLDGITVNVETAKGTYSMSTSNKFEMAAGQYKNLGTLNLEAVTTNKVTTGHIYENGMLTGTKVVVSLAIPEITRQYVTNLSLSVTNANGQVVRSVSKNSAASTETIEPNTEWPYLPKGEYTLTGSYTLGGNTVKEFAALKFNVTADPSFTVTSNAYSSYTKYKQAGAEAANSCQAETIYDIQSYNASISTNILNNSNYSGIKSASIALDGTATTASTVSGQSWGAHTVAATYTFDGVSATGTANCHITGLPYTAAPPTNTGAHPWTDNDSDPGVCYIDWNSDGVKLKGSSQKQTLTSCSFNIPEDTKVKMTVPVKFYSVCVVLIHAQPELVCRIGGTEVLRRTGAQASSGFATNKSEDYTGVGTGILTSSNNTVQVENAYALETAYIYVYSVSLEYQD